MTRLLPLAVAVGLTFTSACTRARELPRIEGEWTSARLPAAPYTHLVFRAYVDAFEITVDGRQIYTFADRAAGQRLRVHAVELPAGSGGRRLGVQLRDRRQSRFSDAAILATPATLPRALGRRWRVGGDADDVTIIAIDVTL